MINQGDYSTKPGWIRMSVHPTMLDEELKYIAESIKALAENHSTWVKDYLMDPKHGDIHYKNREMDGFIQQKVEDFFNLSLM